MLGSLKNLNHVHFIGIGGIGMSGLAQMLLEKGFRVSGSDQGASGLTEKLSEMGATIYLGHKSENIQSPELIVYSSAIKKSNPEWMEAERLEIPFLRRGELLALLLNEKPQRLCIAGSHGKTTTTSLTATIFHLAQKDPTFMIGGVVPLLGGNAHYAGGESFVAEADESDGSFLSLNPSHAVVTNIDDDHLDFYGSKEKIIEAFASFGRQSKLILNANDAGCLALKTERREALWFGINRSADYEAHALNFSEERSFFSLRHQGHEKGEFELHLLGEHNVSNALASLALCHEAGLSFEEIRSGLKAFRGVGRRLETIFQNAHMKVIDDYGHHPSEIKATITALKNSSPLPLIVIFEPHRFTRTQNFWNEFKTCFTGADELYIAPIYAASEAPIESITTDRLVKEMAAEGFNVQGLESVENFESILTGKLQKKVRVLCLGAGPISIKMRQMVKSL